MTRGEAHVLNDPWRSSSAESLEHHFDDTLRTPRTSQMFLEAPPKMQSEVNHIRDRRTRGQLEV